MTVKKKRKAIFWVVVFVCLIWAIQQVFSTLAREDLEELIINEFAAANATGLTDEDGDHSDWIEIYNPGHQPVNLGGWSLTDDPNQLEKWTFPDIVLDGQEYLIVFASGKDRKPTHPGSMLHTNFKLSREDEFLALHNVLYNELSDVPLPESAKQFRDIAYGRYGEGETYGYLATPTPGRPNDETVVWVGVVAPVDFSQERGFYGESLTLELSTTTPGAVIRYTTDGRQPTESEGMVYNEPIVIDPTTFVRAIAFKPGFLPSLVTTHSYISLDEVIHQPSNPPDFPERWGTYGEDYLEYKKDSPVIADYEMDPKVTRDPRYRDSIKDGLKSIPTLSIVTDIQNYDIYGQPRLRGRAYERPVSVELIYPNGEREGFHVEAGLRIQGGWGRWEFVPKHSFRLFFRQEYGFAKLEYPLFPDSPVEKFDTLILRAGTDESYAGKPAIELDHTLDTYTRDEWLRASQIAMSGVGSHGLFVHLYLNGLYWGLYNVVERPDTSFMASYLGGEKEDWYAIKHGFTLIGPDEIREDGEVISGSGERFEMLKKLAYEGKLDDAQRYATIKSYLDTANFIDYIILGWYAGRESEWAANNWYAGVRNPDGRVKYFVWDGEKTWRDGGRIDFGRITDKPNLIKVLFDALMQNPDFKIELADRMYSHLFNNGALTDANAQDRWLRINNQIDQAIVGESARWGDAIHRSPITRDDWLKARDNVLAQMEGNVTRLIAQAREAGYYPNIDPPAFNQNGGLVPAGFNLRMSATQGSIHYTTDGADPRVEVTGEVASGAKVYNTPPVITTTTHIKARALAADGTWSALHEATFKVVERESSLKLTEMMYNPPGGNEYEFIEFKNIGVTDLKLANMYFDEGIIFDFPPGIAPLAPGDFVVLVRNPTAFAERYPGVAIGGTYQGKLSNKGEKVTLRDARGEVLVSIDYDDENGWPISPDGRGDSLVLFNLAGGPNDPRNWRASTNLYGSPGADEPLP